jgi:hypothetical protein
MKKEGTGNPQNPNIAFDAEVRMRELHLEEVPDPEVRFRGNTTRNSVWRSSRENLPDRVREGVVYRNAGVRLRIASEIIESGSVFENTLVKDRVRTNLGYQGRKPARVRPQEYRGEEN